MQQINHSWEAVQMLKLKLTQTITKITFKKNLKIFLLLCLPILTQLNCNTTEPTDDLKPGRRDYTWTVDTLFLPFNPFTDITGTSPSDLWVCSPGDADKIFYHYDGFTWTTDLISRTFSPLSIYSLSGMDVWACGLQGKVWNFDGVTWNQKYKDMNDYTDFISILNVSLNTKYFAGQLFTTNSDYEGLVYKYDGNGFQKINIPKIRTALADIQTNNNGKIFLWGVSNESIGESRYQFYELVGENLKEIYSGSQNTNAEYGSLLQLGVDIYFIIGLDFFSYNENGFQKVGRLTDNSKFRNLGLGRNRKDVFLFMTDGIVHYNGENSTYLYQTIYKSFVSKGILFEKEVFFLGRDTNGNNLIFHGTLKE